MKFYVVIAGENKATYFRNKDNANKLASEIESIFEESAIVLTASASARECKKMKFDDEIGEKYL